MSDVRMWKSDFVLIHDIFIFLLRNLFLIHFINLSFFFLKPLNLSVFKKGSENVDMSGCRIWVMDRDVFALFHDFNCGSSSSCMCHKYFSLCSICMSSMILNVFCNKSSKCWRPILNWLWVDINMEKVIFIVLVIFRDFNPNISRIDSWF